MSRMPAVFGMTPGILRFPSGGVEATRQRTTGRRMGAARRPGVTPAAIRGDRAGALIPAFPALDRVADGFTRRSGGGAASSPPNLARLGRRPPDAKMRTRDAGPPGGGLADSPRRAPRPLLARGAE